MNFAGTDAFRRWDVGDSAATGIRVSPTTGKVYFGDFSGSIIELDPASNTARRFNTGNRPYSIAIDGGWVLATGVAGGAHPDEILQLNPSTGMLTRWDIPGGGLQGFVNGTANDIAIDSEGNVVFTQSASNEIGRLNRSTNTFTEYTKGAISGPAGVASSGSGSTLQIFFTEVSGNNVSILTPSLSTVGVTATVSPMIETLIPTTSTPTPVDFSPRVLTTTITPSIVTVAGTDPSGIIRFPVPAGTSTPRGMTRVAFPGTVLGSLEATNHVFKLKSPEILPQCGNMMIDPNEDCDPPGSMTCPGALACGPDCKCPKPPLCEGVVCTPLDQCHDAGTCDPTTGTCSNPPKPDDTPCEDGNACTTGDTCGGGTCHGGGAITCNDGNPCTDDGCDSASGCFVVNNTAPCSDGNACTTGDTCGGGTCHSGTPTNCDDGNVCTNDSCNTTTGDCAHPHVAGCCNFANECDDANTCTTDTCTNHACVHTPVTGLPAEAPPVCGDMADNDCNGLIDCADPGCGPPVCKDGTKNKQAICNTEQGQMDCTGGGGTCQCPGMLKDPTKITFGRNGNLDMIRSHARVLIDGSVDVAHVPASWLLSDQSGAIYQVGLKAGDLQPNQRGSAFTYKNPDARTNGGVYSATIRISHLGKSYGYKLVAYGNMSRAVDPNMALQFYLDQPTPFIHTEVWRRTASGWVAHSAN